MYREISNDKNGKIVTIYIGMYVCICAVAKAVFMDL